MPYLLAERTNKNRPYFMVSRSMYFYLHSIYGGGPVLVENKKFYEYEEKVNDLDLRIAEIVEYEENKDTQD
jgi:hypothetical protein